MSANCKEVILIAEPTFKATPPSCFIGKEQNGCIKPPSSLAATVITEDDKLNNCSKCITVETVEELDEVQRQVCERPLVLMVTCGKHVPMGQRFVCSFICSLICLIRSRSINSLYNENTWLSYPRIRLLVHLIIELFVYPFICLLILCID